jgi:signal recognition particle subunit SEC65
MDSAARVLDAAIKVAAYPPKKKGQSVSSAQVYWPLIDELRDALDELGIEWRPARWDRVR